jgi:tRNA(fMet)-specific endonuclease VapC
MKILLDTNAYSELMSGNEKVLKIIDESKVIYFSIFVLGELLAGFKKGNKEKHNLDKLKEFLSGPKIILINTKFRTAEIFAEIKITLMKIGKPIPINDIWIAAHCTEYQAKLVTFDKHFASLPIIKLASKD